MDKFNGKELFEKLKMKKQILTIILSFLLTFSVIGNSYAYSDRSKIYIGADYVYSEIKYKNNTVYEMDDGYNGIAPVIGFSSYGIGLELWYLFADETSNQFGYSAELSGYGADLVGEAPLTDNFSLIVSIGLAQYNFKIKQPNNWKVDEDASGPRFGIGLQYEIIPHIALRGMFHYTSLNSGETDFYDGISEFSGGVRIIF